MIHDYESLGWVRFHDRMPPVMEAFRGSDIVDWHGRIEQSLVNLLNDADKASNFTYANRIRAFLETWRENPIDGSLNRETVATLSAAAKQWSREDWDLQSYFLSLHTKLRQLIASEEELPRDIDTSKNDPLMGSHGGAGGAPPMSPSFGPSEGEPEGLGGGGGGGGDAMDVGDLEGEGGAGEDLEGGAGMEGAGGAEGAEATPDGMPGMPDQGDEKMPGMPDEEDKKNPLSI